MPTCPLATRVCVRQQYTENHVNALQVKTQCLSTIVSQETGSTRIEVDRLAGLGRESENRTQITFNDDLRIVL